MSKILTVHGTFASGPEAGDKWWQHGSPCSTHIAELVEADTGRVEIVPVIWDGLNSEQSRQAGAAKLLDRMTELEKSGEPYCVVGHSHGGSVISAALLRAAFYKRPLDKLSRWITIGTPFIEAKRSRLLFARLGPGGKTAFLSILALAIGMIFFISRTLRQFTQAMSGQSPSVDELSTFVVYNSMILIAVISYLILWFWARHRLFWHNWRLHKAAQKSFSEKWISLRHADDEAVQGLGAFKFVKHPIFARDFAVVALSRSAILVVPAVIYLFLAATPPTLLFERVAEAARDEQHKNAPPPELASATKSENITRETPAAVLKPSDTSKLDWADMLTIVGIFALVFGAPVFIYYLTRLLARPTSWALSYGMNKLTWSQLRASSLGSDIDGESGRHARAGPMWLEDTSRPLPAALAAEIHTVSDAAAAKSIAKFRAALSELAFCRLEEGGKDALNAFLTGEELIHTTYFNIPRFRKLLAYSIAQSPGFRPSAALRNDPDFPLIEQWYRELTSSTVPASAQPAGAVTPQQAAAPVVLQPN